LQAHLRRLARHGGCQKAKKAYLLCATEKFGKAYYHNLCHKSQLTGIIHE
jgi:DeoR/GlpR family transcriptional regulator of sugar metabolism